MTRRGLALAACLTLSAGCDPAGTGASPGPSGSPSTAVAAATPTATASSPGAGGLSGTWSALPRSPLSDRLDAAVVWTGRYLFVWGGETARHNLQFGDGAVYDVSTGRWQPLPVAPLSARTRVAAVWTGREVLIWGGRSGEGVDADGASWDPATDSWAGLPAAPLRARAGALATWTGNHLIVLGSDAGSGGGRPFLDGASFDPGAGVWRMLPAAPFPDDLPALWRATVTAGHDLLAWSVLGTRHPGLTGGAPGSGGALYRYDLYTDSWTAVPTAPGALPDVGVTVWTGSQVVVRGGDRLCTCGALAFTPELTSGYRSATNTWTRLPADPLSGARNGVGLRAAWAGALFSFNPAGRGGSVEPGDASAWDPATNTWHRLPSAPFGCPGIGGQNPGFLDGAVGYWCPHPASGPASDSDGLLFTLTPSAGASPTG